MKIILNFTLVISTLTLITSCTESSDKKTLPLPTISQKIKKELNKFSTDLELSTGNTIEKLYLVPERKSRFLKKHPPGSLKYFSIPLN